jgi:acetylornithine deacetylase/succinyl-diaminopimelate desuccinylase-like protein
MDHGGPLADRVRHIWEDEALPTLVELVRIPNVSASYDPDWAANGHMARAVELLREWAAARPIAGMTVEVHELPGRTPVILVEVPAANGGPADDTVLLYGHLDKQPEMTGWRDGLGPWTPVIEGDRLYGRGGADDGYSLFAALTAIQVAGEDGLPRARCVVLVEASEESGSPDLPAHLEALQDRIGAPSLVITLDGGGLDYERLWLNTSLRGLAGGVLRVDVLHEGMHSGSASGVVPSSFRIIRQLLDRVEDAATGRVLIDEMHAEIPADRVRQAAALAEHFAADLATEFPTVAGLQPMGDDATSRELNRTWRPALSVVGAGGLPPVERAGNVLRPFTELLLSFRLPPTVDHRVALGRLAEVLTTDPPHGAIVTFTPDHGGDGWQAPPFDPWLERALDEASVAAFGRPAQTLGEGGSIPFMAMLGQRYPEAQFVITGVIGPATNAHGPNEFLHMPTARRVTEAMALLLAAHARRP